MVKVRFTGEHAWHFPQPDPNLSAEYNFEAANNYTQEVAPADFQFLTKHYGEQSFVEVKAPNPVPSTGA